MDLREVGWVGGWRGVMDWIDLAQNWDRWRAVVNAVMNLLVSQEGLCSMELVINFVGPLLLNEDDKNDINICRQR